MADIAKYCDSLGDFSEVAHGNLTTQELACAIYAAVIIFVEFMIEPGFAAIISLHFLIYNAQGESSSATLANEMDAFFLLLMATLVFFMQTSFAMLYAGSVR